MGVLSMLRQRSHDGKVNVRKSAVVAVEELMKQDETCITPQVKILK